MVGTILHLHSFGQLKATFLGLTSSAFRGQLLVSNPIVFAILGDFGPSSGGSFGKKLNFSSANKGHQTFPSNIPSSSHIPNNCYATVWIGETHPGSIPWEPSPDSFLWRGSCSFLLNVRNHLSTWNRKRLDPKRLSAISTVLFDNYHQLIKHSRAVHSLQNYHKHATRRRLCDPVVLIDIMAILPVLLSLLMSQWMRLITECSRLRLGFTIALPRSGCSFSFLEIDDEIPEPWSSLFTARRLVSWKGRFMICRQRFGSLSFQSVPSPCGANHSCWCPPWCFALASIVIEKSCSLVFFWHNPKQFKIVKDHSSEEFEVRGS
jgi:hypothetical protein